MTECWPHPLEGRTNPSIIMETLQNRFHWTDRVCEWIWYTRVGIIISYSSPISPMGYKYCHTVVLLLSLTGRRIWIIQLQTRNSKSKQACYQHRYYTW